MPEQSAYDDTYSSWKSWDAARFAYYSAKDQAYFAGELARARPKRQGECRILEIGFGNGAFLGWARDAGYVCEGIEANPGLIRRAMASGFTVREAIDDIPADVYYDVIVAWDVLEHVPDASLVSFVVALSRRLDHDGSVLLRFPNGDSPLVGLYQNGDMTHRSAIGAGKMRQIASIAGFSVDYLGVPFVPPPAIFRERLKKRILLRLRSLTEAVVCSLYLDGQRIPFYPLLVAVLRKSKNDVSATKADARR